jgi:hypothetical protein
MIPVIRRQTLVSLTFSSTWASRMTVSDDQPSKDSSGSWTKELMSTWLLVP